MLIYILFISGLVSALCAVSIVLLQFYKIKRGLIHVDENFDGPKQVSLTLRIILRYFLRRSVHFRKFIMQYALHMIVRVMFYLDKGFSKLYAFSRNMFVKNAVRNRGTVPHFWNHLKVYKQEMDKERAEDSTK
ncbi:TPA: hypothetical protein DEP94_01850 [Candidatus Nomurabacteria bacterium]|nr:hypothetical protein [Candidatus Nomurabacteria bacterium]